MFIKALVSLALLMTTSLGDVVNYDKNSGINSMVNTLKQAEYLKKTQTQPKLSKDNNENPCASMVAYQIGWKNWQNDVITFAPIFRPTNDTQLKKIVKSAKQHNCTIRAMGATHSQDGLIMQKRETNVIIVSLASHVTTEPGWADGIDLSTGVATIGAGKSFYDFMAITRPQGFVLNQVSAGRFFSVGGVIANQVHGGGLQNGFLHDPVSELLVLTADEQFRVINGPELKYWKSSAGQLGLIVSSRWIMNHDNGLVMDRSILQFPPLLKPAIQNMPTPAEWAILQGQIYSIVNGVTVESFTKLAMSHQQEFFFDPFGLSMRSYYNSYSGIPYPDPITDPVNFGIQKTVHEMIYSGLKLRYPDSGFTGGFTFDLGKNACDYLCYPGTGPSANPPFSVECSPIYILLQPYPVDPIIVGPPPYNPPGSIRGCDNALWTAAVISISQGITTDTMWDYAKNDILPSPTGPKDGFFLTDVALFESLIIVVPAGGFSSMFGTYLGVTLEFLGNDALGYKPNGNLEWRFINPNDTAYLNPNPTYSEYNSDFMSKNGAPLSAFFPGAPEGLVIAEVTTMRDVHDEFVSHYFKAMQDAWLNMKTNPLIQGLPNVVDTCNLLQGIVPCDQNGNSVTPNPYCCNPTIPANSMHLGKGWGYGVDYETTPFNGKLQPFTDPLVIASTYSNPAKAADLNAFKLKMAELDPSGLFSGGAMQRWLNSVRPNSDFDPRGLVDQVCPNRLKSQYYPDDFTCISNCCDTVYSSNLCLSSDLKKNQNCFKSCQCLSGLCLQNGKCM